MTRPRTVGPRGGTLQAVQGSGLESERGLKSSCQFLVLRSGAGCFLIPEPSSFCDVGNRVP